MTNKERPETGVRSARATRHRTRRMWFGALVLVVLLATTAPVHAAIEAGTIIDKGNLNQMLNESFEGETLDTMLPGSIKRMITEWGLEIRIAPSREYTQDPRWVKATEEYKGQPSIDPETGQIQNWKAGAPFPDLSPEDEFAGLKAYYNKYYGWNHGNFQNAPFFTYLFVDGNSGVERTQNWNFQVLYNTGLNSWTGDHAIGSGETRFKQYIFGVKPYDIKGTGTFTIRYESGRTDDIWAYIRSVRRVRRLTGGTWFDPIDGTDQRFDEIDVISPYPTWYDSWKYLEQRTILAPIRTGWPTVMEGSEDMRRRFPGLDTQKAPYWNPSPDFVRWEPRRVHVIEAIPPEGHPYVRKIIYCDTKMMMCFFAENYNEDGDLLKMVYSPQRLIEGPTPIPRVENQRLSWVSSLGFMIDFNEVHATIYAHNKETLFGDIPSTISPEDFNIANLRKGEPVRY